MTWKCIKSIGLFWLFGVLVACSDHVVDSFSKQKEGCYFKLISFEKKICDNQFKSMAHLSATFSTQKDSVFWDSFNQLSNRFYLVVDTIDEESNFLNHQVSKACEQDSICLLIPVQQFYSQQFQSLQIPFFSLNDTVVKVNFKVLKFLTIDEIQQHHEAANLLEQERIYKYFGSAEKCSAAKDSCGFYWVERPKSLDSERIKDGMAVSIQYEGFFLNGRFLEKSNENFEYTIGVPDQILKGLKYVIPMLKKGENAKIILPSPLAFGEFGSSNGTVPPYTPVLYNIKLIDVKEK